MSNHIGSFKGNVCCLYNPTHNLTSYIRTLKESFDLSFLLDPAAETTLIALFYVTPCSKPSFLIAPKLGHSKPFTIWLPPSLPGLFLTTYTILLPTTHHYGNKSCLFLPLCFCSNLFFLEHSWDLSNSSVNWFWNNFSRCRPNTTSFMNTFQIPPMGNTFSLLSILQLLFSDYLISKISNCNNQLC